MKKAQKEIIEKVIQLNFRSHYTDLVNFSRASWSLSSSFLSSLGTIQKLSPKQRVVIFMIGKSMRLLSSIDTLVEIGYWPEAEILLRAILETQQLMLYILKDKTNERAKKWLNREKATERWDWKEITKEYGKTYETMYSNLSLYPHGHILSVQKYMRIKDGMLFVEKGSLPLGIEPHGTRSKEVLGTAAMINAAMCEIGSSQFNLPNEWHTEHIQLEQMSFWKERQKNVKEALADSEKRKIIENMRKTMKSLHANFTIVFVHGYTASHLADWYPTISEELDRLGIDYVIPDLPGGDTPHVNGWLSKLHGIVKKIDKPLIFVGHSLGARTVLLYLEKYKPKVEKVFLIAAFANDIDNAKRKDGKYSTFFQNKIDLKNIKPFVKKFIVMHSEDDSSIPYKQGKQIADELNAELITYKDRDHFSNPNNALFILEQLRKELRF
ncbi:MAG TPA: alpha/beta fold hydrolase [Candidatus Sulfotelmatobacter sp.]|jgi:predicted alpha/beta hydrolase family esterase|nr:alpha/beta fold hydrolase [Candidatus Sulfotelmatobacter sp.]